MSADVGAAGDAVRSIPQQLREPGLYVVGDTLRPDYMVPIYVDHAGDAWTMEKDAVLRPDGWKPTAVVYSGPHRPPSWGGLALATPQAAPADASPCPECHGTGGPNPEAGHWSSCSRHHLAQAAPADAQADDIVTRLRNRTLPADGGPGDFDHSMKHHWNLTGIDSAMHAEAAAEIERLRAQAAPVVQEPVAVPCADCQSRAACESVAHCRRGFHAKGGSQ